LYISDNQSSRPPLLQKEGKFFHAGSEKIKLKAMGFGAVEKVLLDWYAKGIIL
jgi:hypothetical protein